MAVLFERTAIVGVGLIGGSLALAGRRAGLLRSVVGFGRRAENLARAKELGIVDETSGRLSDVASANLVVLAVPVLAMERVARDLVPHLSAGVVVTDVGSVKRPIVDLMDRLLDHERAFVGAHPIAGSERTGAAAADADLFRGAVCVTTPTANTDAAALERVEALWRGVGASVERMGPDAHDRALAWTSHLPHVLAYVLAEAVAAGDSHLLRLAGPSLRDATRVALSSPEIWSEIFLANRDAVSAAILTMRERLESLRAVIDGGDEQQIMRRLEAGRAARKRLEKEKKG